MLGYSLTDCPILTEPESWPHEYNIYGWEREQTPTWPRILRNLDERSAGKRAYVETVRELYADDVGEFNRGYSTDFDSFDALQRATNWRHRAELDNTREARDNAEFLLRVIDRCYDVEVAAIRKHDPNHLIFGDKFQGNRMGLPVPVEHVELAAKHFDLLFFQKYGVWADLEPLLDLFRKHGGGKPAYMGDSSMNVAKEKLPDPFGPRCANQEIRRAPSRKHSTTALCGPISSAGTGAAGWISGWTTPTTCRPRIRATPVCRTRSAYTTSRSSKK